MNSESQILLTFMGDGCIIGTAFGVGTKANGDFGRIKSWIS